MESFARAIQIQTDLEDAWDELGLPAPLEVPRVVVDPRNAIPPCIMLTPPTLTYDTACGASHEWTLALLAPGPGNADSWKVLDALLRVAAAAFTIERARPSSVVLEASADPLPAYLATFSEAV